MGGGLGWSAGGGLGWSAGGARPATGPEYHLCSSAAGHVCALPPPAPEGVVAKTDTGPKFRTSVIGRPVLKKRGPVGGLRSHTTGYSTRNVGQGPRSHHKRTIETVPRTTPDCYDAGGLLQRMRRLRGSLKHIWALSCLKPLLTTILHPLRAHTRIACSDHAHFALTPNHTSAVSSAPALPSPARLFLAFALSCCPPTRTEHARRPQLHPRLTTLIPPLLLPCLRPRRHCRCCEAPAFSSCC